MEKKEAKKRHNTIWSVLSFRNVCIRYVRQFSNTVFLKPHSALAGFTLIELVIVVSIAALLITAFLLFGNPSQQSAKAKDSQRINDVRQLKAALDLYYDDHKCYPDTIPSDTWIENGTVYMIKVPKDPDTGTAINSGYLYQVDSSDTCPQWNVLYTTYTSREFTEDDCPLSAMSSCNYSGSMACSISGQVDCNYVSNNPVSVAEEDGVETVQCPAESPLIYNKDNEGNCNVAPENQGVFCIEQC